MSLCANYNLSSFFPSFCSFPVCSLFIIPCNVIIPGQTQVRAEFVPRMRFFKKLISKWLYEIMFLSASKLLSRQRAKTWTKNRTTWARGLQGNSGVETSSGGAHGRHCLSYFELSIGVILAKYISNRTLLLLRLEVPKPQTLALFWTSTVMKMKIEGNISAFLV